MPDAGTSASIEAASDGQPTASTAEMIDGHPAPPAVTGWMHADLHPGNFLLLPGGRLGMVDFGAVAATPGGIPAPFGQLASPRRPPRASPTRGPGCGLMAYFTEPRFAPALRNLSPPREYALLWRASLSAAGLFAQLGATVPTRGFQLAYSPGFRDGIAGGYRAYGRADQG